MMDFPQFRDLGFGVTRIDTGLGRPGMAACYLMAHNDRLAVIETGTNRTVPKILELIEQKGYGRDQVDYVIITHVHLDHAGGAGGLMRELPAAKLVVHPRGARHMEDPSKLQAGAMAVYGEESYRQQYGELIPIPADRMIVAEDGTRLSLADRELVFFDTPGHARHHFCVHDPFSQGIFTGDTLGIVYSELCEGHGSFVMPTTTPVQFEPEELKQSVDRLMTLQPERFFLTHYGMVEETPAHAEQLKGQVDDYVRIALAHKDDGEERQKNISAALLQHTLQALSSHGSPLGEDQQRERIIMDMMLNAQGLDVWLKKQEASQQNA